MDPCFEVTKAVLNFPITPHIVKNVVAVVWNTFI